MEELRWEIWGRDRNFEGCAGVISDDGSQSNSNTQLQRVRHRGTRFRNGRKRAS